jgi:predicted ATPase
VSDVTARPWHPSVPDGLRDGNAEAFGVSIAEITMAHGATLALGAPGVTAVVGGNNVGKSTALRNMREALYGGESTSTPRIVEAVRLDKSGSAADAIAWLDANLLFVETPNAVGYSIPSQGVIPPQQCAIAWKGSLLGLFAPITAELADPISRAQLIEPVAQRGSLDEPPSHPLHYAEEDRTVFDTLDAYCDRIFMQRLTLDRLTPQLALRVGSLPLPVPAVDNVSREYRAAMRALKPVAVQGDGMRSLLGLLLTLVAGVRKIVFVDEPEAFLHPPQAIALGRALGEIARKKGIQVILATHDRNILVGLLSDPGEVSVIRLTRTADVTTARHLDRSMLRDA